MICPFCLKEFNPKGYKVHVIFVPLKQQPPKLHQIILKLPLKHLVLLENLESF